MSKQPHFKAELLESALEKNRPTRKEAQLNLEVLAQQVAINISRIDVLVSIDVAIVEPYLRYFEEVVKRRNAF